MSHVCSGVDRDFGHLIWQISSELSHLHHGTGGSGTGGGGMGGTDKAVIEGSHGGQGLGSSSSMTHKDPSSPMRKSSTKSVMSNATEKGGGTNHAVGVTTPPTNHISSPTHSSPTKTPQQ